MTHAFLTQLSSELEVRDALGEVMRGRTTIVIAHRPATIALADRVVLVRDGRVVADGTHAHLLATDAEYRSVLAAAEGDVEGDAEGDADRAGESLRVVAGWGGQTGRER